MEQEFDFVKKQEDFDFSNIEPIEKNEEEETIVDLDGNVIIPTFSERKVIELVGKQLRGNPYGTYKEKIDFVKWILETPRLRNSRGFLKTFMENYDKPQKEEEIGVKKPIDEVIYFMANSGRMKGVKDVAPKQIEFTTEFFQNLAPEAKTQRIRELRKQIGYKVIPVNYYFKEWVNAKTKTDLTTYKFSKDGKILFDKKERTVGRMVRRNTKKVFGKWITKEEFNRLQEELNAFKNKCVEKYDSRDYYKERTLNNCFAGLEGGEFKDICKRELSEVEFGAIDKIQNPKPKKIMKKCEGCGKITCFVQFTNDIELCKDCFEHPWKEEKIVEWVSKLDKNKIYQFPTEKFCGFFRYDKRENPYPIDKLCGISHLKRDERQSIFLEEMEFHIPSEEEEIKESKLRVIKDIAEILKRGGISKRTYLVGKEMAIC